MDVMHAADLKLFGLTLMYAADLKLFELMLMDAFERSMEKLASPKHKLRLMLPEPFGNRWG